MKNKINLLGKNNFVVKHKLKFERMIIMEKQKINCTVGSCKFNDCDNQMCLLKQITVTPTPNNNTKNTDESMCSSYQNL